MIRIPYLLGLRPSSAQFTVIVTVSVIDALAVIYAVPVIGAPAVIDAAP